MANTNPPQSDFAPEVRELLAKVLAHTYTEFAEIDNCHDDGDVWVAQISVAIEKPEVRDAGPKVYTAKASITTDLEATFTEREMLEAGYQDPHAYAKDYLEGSDYTEVQGSGSFNLCYVETDHA